jgi:hypothetical protein
VNDHTTSVLRSRLHQLADELTPPLDVVGEVRAARLRRRRQRRVRITLVAAATVTAGALIGVPLTIDSLTSAPSGGVAGPASTSASSTTSDPGDADRRAAEDAVRRAQEADRTARLDGVAEDLRAALRARPTPLSLGAPPALGSCPEMAPTVNRSFGADLAEHSSGAAGGDCVWRTPDGHLQLTIGFMAGGTIDQIHADVDAEKTRAGCYPTALPGSLTFTALALCEEGEGTGWHLRVMDTSGTGFWLISVTVGDRSPEDATTTVAAVLDAADADL